MKPTVDIERMSDETLVQEIIKSRNSAFFAVLYDRYASQVFNKCLGFAKSKVEAEDLTHDIFIKLFVKLSTFKGKAKFSTWLYSFTYNYCVNYVQRDAYKNKEVVSEVESKDTTTEISDAELFEIKTANLKTAMDQIDPKHKMILLLKYQDECSIKEIQELLNLNESAVKMRLKRAKESVMEVYKNCNNG